MLPSHSDQAAVIAARSAIGAPSDLAAALATHLGLRRDPAAAPASVLLLASPHNAQLREALHDAAPGCVVKLSTGPAESLAADRPAGSFDAVALVGDLLSRLLPQGSAADANAVAAARLRLAAVVAQARALLADGGALYVDCPPDGPIDGERDGVPVSNEPELAADVVWHFEPDFAAGTQKTVVKVRVHGEPEVSIERLGLLVGKAQVSEAVSAAGFNTVEAVPTPKGSNEVLQGYIARLA